MAAGLALHSTLQAFAICLWSAPPPGVSLAELWYREVIEGNVALAAKELETLYLSQPSEALPPQTQQKAAYRAGRCFEQLSLRQSAEPAYLAAVKLNGAPTSAAARRDAEAAAGEALLRLRELNRATAAAQQEDDVGLSLAVQAGAEVWRAAEKARAGAIVGLEEATAAVRRSLDARRELLASLEARGVHLAFARGELDGGGEAIVLTLNDMLGAEPGLPALVRNAVRERSFAQALRAVTARDVSRAWRELRRFRVLGAAASNTAGGEPRWIEAAGAGVIGDLARAGGTDIGAADLTRLARVAGRRLVDFELDRKSALVGEILKSIEESGAARDRGRKGEAWSALEKARQACEWSDRPLREDHEVSALWSEVRLKLRLLARDAAIDNVLVKLGALLDEHADRLVERTALWLDTALDEARLRSRAELRGRIDAELVCQTELESLLAQARAGARAREDGRWSLDAAGTAALGRAGWLADWLPQIVGPGHRAALEALGSPAAGVAPGKGR